MLTIKKGHALDKVGIDEILGLKKAMIKVMEPIRKHLKINCYWSDVELTESEYKSRDGFIPYSHNCGGIEILEIIPKCCEYDFPFLEFGQCNECNSETQCGYNGQECAEDYDGLNNAKLRVWLKFEELEDGIMSFYLYCGGGNGDAPYFRTKYETDIFESDFTAKTLTEFRQKAKIQINRLIKKLS